MNLQERWCINSCLPPWPTGTVWLLLFRILVIVAKHLVIWLALFSQRCPLESREFLSWGASGGTCPVRPNGQGGVESPWLCKYLRWQKQLCVQKTSCWFFGTLPPIYERMLFLHLFGFDNTKSLIFKEYRFEFHRDIIFARIGEFQNHHIVWKLLKMSRLNFGIFHQFLSYYN